MTFWEAWLLQLVPLVALVAVDVIAPKNFKYRGFVFGALMSTAFVIGSLIKK